MIDPGQVVKCLLEQFCRDIYPQEEQDSARARVAVAHALADNAESLIQWFNEAEVHLKLRR